MRTIESDMFNCKVSERAAFEAGIKMGSLFHQFMGTPVSLDSRSSLEEAMTEAALTQPHVREAEVKINERSLHDSLNPMGYTSLSERMIEARIVVVVGDTECTARMGWVEEMGYPLMWIESMAPESRSGG